MAALRDAPDDETVPLGGAPRPIRRPPPDVETVDSAPPRRSTHPQRTAPETAFTPDEPADSAP